MVRARGPTRTPARDPESQRGGARSHCILLNLDTCTLCGCVLFAGVERRYKLLQFLAALLEEKCILSPFVFAHIAGLAAEEREAHLAPGRRDVVGCLCKERCLRAGNCGKAGGSPPSPASVTAGQLLLNLVCQGAGSEIRQGGCGGDDGVSEQIGEPGSEIGGNAQLAWLAEEAEALEQEFLHQEDHAESKVPIEKHANSDDDDDDDDEEELMRELEMAMEDDSDKDSIASDARGTDAYTPQFCTKGVRVPLCIACINWVRRRVKSRTKTYVPLDNLLLWVDDPGRYREPDKRSMFRLLQHMSIVFTHNVDLSCPHDGAPGSSRSPAPPVPRPMRIVNPYMRFASPVFQCVCAMFRHKYFPSYRLDTSFQHLWKPIRNCRKKLSPADRMKVRPQPSRSTDKNTALLNSIIHVWWSCNGMPEVLQSRVIAKYVRKMLRDDRAC